MWQEWLTLAGAVVILVIATSFTFFPRKVQSFQLRNIGSGRLSPRQFIESDRFIPFARLLGVGFYFIGTVQLLMAISR